MAKKLDGNDAVCKSEFYSPNRTMEHSQIDLIGIFCGKKKRNCAILKSHVREIKDNDIASNSRV